MLGQLLVVNGPDRGRSLPLTDGKTILIGSSRGLEAGRLNDPQVARVHIEIETGGGKARVVDCGTPAGTLVNGKRVSAADLKAGDVIRIGETELRFQPDAGDSAPISLVDGAETGTVKPLKAGKLDELLGTTISHYEIRSPLAAGNNGRVFYAWDTKGDRPAALKVLWPEISRDSVDAKRFIRAMKTVLPIRHPNLIQLYGAGKTGSNCWCAMEYVEGLNLGEIIRQRGIAQGLLPWEFAFRTAIGVTRGLMEADANRVVHRNVTPSNILISAVDHVTKLGDLMLAKALEGPLAQNLTQPNQIVGSVEYMPPERFTGSSAIDERSDIYGLGATLYALLTGKPPITAGKSPIQTMERILKTDPERPKKFQSGMPELFDKMVLRMLAKDPGDRFGSATALFEELGRVAKLQSSSLERMEAQRFEGIDPEPRSRVKFDTRRE